MAQKNVKKQKELRTTLLVILVPLLVVAALGALIYLLTREKPAPAPIEIERTTQEAFPFDIDGFTLIEDAEVGDVDDTLRVVGVGKYTGLYLEQDEKGDVTDVLAIVVQNTGSDWILNADVALDCGGETAEFSMTGLPGSAYALVLEKNALVYTEDMLLRSPACTFLTGRDDSIVDDFGEEFYLEIHEGIFVLQNVSGREIAGGAAIAYKNYENNNGIPLYLGGVTYRMSFEGPIAVDEVRQSKPRHYTDGGSVILYMTYDK